MFPNDVMEQSSCRVIPLGIQTGPGHKDMTVPKPRRIFGFGCSIFRGGSPCDVFFRFFYEFLPFKFELIHIHVSGLAIIIVFIIVVISSKCG